MFCHNCGNRLPDDARFCFNCGAEQLPEMPEPAPWATRAPKPAEPAPSVPETPEEPAPEADGPDMESPPQPVTVPVQLPGGTFTWEHVTISGEFKDGKGTITIHFE